MTDTTNSFRAFSRDFLLDERVKPFRAVFDSYNLPYYLDHPLDILKLWDGGMSFHGGVIGTSLGILYLSWKEKLQWLRIHDYVACCVPFGLFFGRLANFVNQELWGATTDVPWAIRFVEATPYGATLGPPRHPSQLYEGRARRCPVVRHPLAHVLADAIPLRPGKLVGHSSSSTASSASALSIFGSRTRRGTIVRGDRPAHGPVADRADDLGGLYLMVTAKKRRGRSRPTAGSASVA
jgi:phosphatidylglycerol:prolipoprotein diacylglycerol transferase